jgi:hypothetical protein
MAPPSSGTRTGASFSSLAERSICTRQICVFEILAWVVGKSTKPIGLRHEQRLTWVASG